RRLSRNKNVVLNNKIIPIGHPYCAVRTDLGCYRTEPFVGTRQQVPAIFFFKASAIRLYHRVVNQSHGRFGNKSHPVPILFGEVPGGIELVSGSRSKSSDHINLS